MENLEEKSQVKSIKDIEEFLYQIIRYARKVSASKPINNKQTP